MLRSFIAEHHAHKRVTCIRWVCFYRTTHNYTSISGGCSWAWSTNLQPGCHPSAFEMEEEVKKSTKLCRLILSVHRTLVYTKTVDLNFRRGEIDPITNIQFLFVIFSDSHNAPELHSRAQCMREGDMYLLGMATADVQTLCGGDFWRTEQSLPRSTLQQSPWFDLEDD